MMGSQRLLSAYHSPFPFSLLMVFSADIPLCVGPGWERCFYRWLLSLGCYPCLVPLPFGVSSLFLPVFPMTTTHCSPPGPGRVCPADGCVVNGHHGPFTITITPSSLPVCSSLAGSRHTAVAPAVVGWILLSMFPLPLGEWPVLHSGLLGGEARALWCAPHLPQLARGQETLLSIPRRSLP